MSLDKNKLKKNLLQIYTAKTADAAYKQWNNSLADYFRDAQLNGFSPSGFMIDLPNEFKKSANSKTFVEDFGKNLSQWASNITWSDQKETKKSIAPPDIDFKSFSKLHEKDTNIDAYINDLATLLHEWFLKITI